MPKKLKMYSGCGWLNDEEIKPHAIGCCPDGNFHDVPEKLTFWIKAHRDAYKKLSALLRLKSGKSLRED